MCNSCEVVSINGVNCHEAGCPESWKDYEEECKECGQEFTPTFEGEECCSESCHAMYNGWPVLSEEEE